MKTLMKADREALKSATPGTFKISGNIRSFRIGNMVVSYSGNGGGTPEHEAVCFHSKTVGEEADIMSDYFPGTFHNTLTAAIRFVKRYQGL